MIDAEVKIFNKMHDLIAPMCAPNRFLSRQIADYAKLPAVAFFEMGNDTDRWRNSTSPEEDFAILAYQLDVVAESKAKCRKIFAEADALMLRMNFNRMSLQPIEYPDNPKIYRYTARYEAEIDQNGVIYKRR